MKIIIKFNGIGESLEIGTAESFRILEERMVKTVREFDDQDFFDGTLIGPTASFVELIGLKFNDIESESGFIFPDENFNKLSQRMPIQIFALLEDQMTIIEIINCWIEVCGRTKHKTWWRFEDIKHNSFA